MDTVLLDVQGEYAVVDSTDKGRFTSSSSGGSWISWTYSSSQAWQNQVTYIKTGGPLSAAWSVDAEPGVYEVGVSWEPATNRSTAVSYQVRDVAGGNAQSAAVNQQSNPASGTYRTVDGKPFRLLTTAFTVGALSKSLTVSLTAASATSTTQVVADAVYVRRIAPLGVSPLMLAARTWPRLSETRIRSRRDRSTRAVGPVCRTGPESPTDPAVPNPATSRSVRTEVPSGRRDLPAGDLPADALGQTVAQAAAWWQAQGLDDRQLRALRGVEYAIADLPGATLGWGSSAAGRIWIDTDAASADGQLSVVSCQWSMVSVTDNGRRTTDY